MREFKHRKWKRPELVRDRKIIEETRNNMERLAFERLHSKNIGFKVTHSADLGILFDSPDFPHFRRNFTIQLNDPIPVEIMLKILEDLKPEILRRITNAIEVERKNKET